MRTRAAIYARVSTLAGQSPQMQLDVLREYAVRALGAWDAAHRAAFVDWATRPWWP